MRSVIICVDDDKWILTVLSDQLNEWFGKNYIVEKALSSQEALEIVDSCMEEGLEISLIISDYIMPGMKGDELLEQVKLKSPLTRRIMLTGFAAIEGITNAINKASIYRFMSKPWDNKDMMLTSLQAIRSYEQDKRAEQLANSHKELYHKFQNLAVDLQSKLQHAVHALSVAADARVGSFVGHSNRVALYCGRMAEALKMPEEEAKNLEMSALLHDVGRLGMKDEDLVTMRNADYYANNELALKQARVAEVILSKMDNKILRGIVYHMERVDGLGPHGMGVPDIPLEARIIGLCSYYDVLCATRPSDTPANILKAMNAYSGKFFDKILYDAFVKTF